MLWLIRKIKLQWGEEECEKKKKKQGNKTLLSIFLKNVWKFTEPLKNFVNKKRLKITL